MTVRLVPENFTRAPLELGCSPSRGRRIPAFTSSSLYFPISENSCSVGRIPASDCLLALTMTMNRIFVSPGFRSVSDLADLQTHIGFHQSDERADSKSTRIADFLLGAGKS